MEALSGKMALQISLYDYSVCGADFWHAKRAQGIRAEVVVLRDFVWGLSGVTEQTHGCAVLGTPCRGPVREADVVWVQISPEEVKALDAQWEELAMRSDMPVTMDDIQEVPSSHPSSPSASRYLTPRKHTLLPETWMMTRSPPRERWRSRYELQHQSTRMHHSTQNTICSVLLRYLPCLSFCVSSRV